MKFASYLHNGAPGYGVVKDGALADLTPVIGRAVVQIALAWREEMLAGRLAASGNFSALGGIISDPPVPCQAAGWR